jgi:hypothetical protein
MHLQFIVLLHQPGSPVLAATQTCGLTAQLQTCEPHVVPGQSLSNVHARASRLPAKKAAALSATVSRILW